MARSMYLDLTSGIALNKSLFAPSVIGYVVGYIFMMDT